jgi:subfamily B ATP-binding cassette protein MsbA
MLRRSREKNGSGILAQKTDIDSTHSWVLMKRLLREHVKPQRKRLLLAVLLMAVFAGTNAAVAKLMEPIVNEAFYRGNLHQLYSIAAAVVVIFVIRGWATYGQSTLLNYAGQSIVADLQKRLFRHIIWADLSFFSRQSPGALTARFTNDANMLRGAVSNTLTSFGRDLLSLIGLLALMFYQDWILACIAFIGFPIAVLPIARLGKRMRRVSRSQQQQTGLLATLLDEAFQGVRQVKAHGMEAHEASRVGGTVTALFKLATKAERTRALSNPALESLAGVAIAAVMIYGGHQVIAGGKTPGAFFSFIAAVLLAYEPIKRLSQLNTSLQEGLAAAERVFAMLDAKPAITDRPEAPLLQIRGGAVTLQDVTFTYGGESAALDRLDLDIPAGATVALVGPSGAGKSTVFNLILRFFDPDSGRVLIDGQDLRDIRLNSLRAAIAMVSQDSLLFDDTVRANILYGRPTATPEEVVAAATSAHADGFIRELPEGYDTPVGPRGVRLSGGQRQRILIARAMLRDAPILLLDEATSALDNESERIVQAALQHLKRGRTTIVIAHRLSTVVAADCIYVMEYGRVVERGRHAELLASDGVYARLYAQQFAEEGETAPAREAVL